MTARKVCVDCVPGSRRPTPHPGPRCASHWRVERKRRSEVAWDRRIRSVYGIGAVEYAAILEAQGGACFICQRATGATKRLAVDHDHLTGAVRGILCGPCNRLLGHLRDDVDAARRVVSYLERPPAVSVLEAVRHGDGRTGGFGTSGAGGAVIGAQD